MAAVCSDKVSNIRNVVRKAGNVLAAVSTTFLMSDDTGYNDWGAPGCTRVTGGVPGVHRGELGCTRVHRGVPGRVPKSISLVRESFTDVIH